MEDLVFISNRPLLPKNPAQAIVLAAKGIWRGVWWLVVGIFTAMFVPSKVDKDLEAHREKARRYLLQS